MQGGKGKATHLVFFTLAAPFPFPFAGAFFGLSSPPSSSLSSLSLFGSSWAVSVLLRFGSVSSAFDCSCLRPRTARGAAEVVGVVGAAPARPERS